MYTGCYVEPMEEGPLLVLEKMVVVPWRSVEVISYRQSPEIEDSSQL